MIDVDDVEIPDKGASHSKGGSHPKHDEQEKGENAHLDLLFKSSRNEW